MVLPVKWADPGVKPGCKVGKWSTCIWASRGWPQPLPIPAFAPRKTYEFHSVSKLSRLSFCPYNRNQGGHPRNLHLAADREEPHVLWGHEFPLILVTSAVALAAASANESGWDGGR